MVTALARARAWRTLWASVVVVSAVSLVSYEVIGALEGVSAGRLAR